jgi:hypothetical protein
VKRLPLLPITAAFAAGIGAAPHTYLRAPEQLFFLSVLILAAGLLLRFGYNSCGLICCWLGFFLCGTFLTAQEHAYLPSGHLDRLVRQEMIALDRPVQLVGWAQSPTTRRPGHETFDLQLSSVHQEGHDYRADGQVRV